ncbi:MAG: SRPBCC family protein [Gallionellaceae bacterium]
MIMSTPPDLSLRPFQLTVERNMAASPHALYQGWTRKIDRWFAAPGTVLMRPEIDSPFFFETNYGGHRHPHYGRFLKLVPDQLIELTWITGKGGTEGAETIVTVTLTPNKTGTHIQLVHAGFYTADSKNNHEQAWPLVLAQLDERMTVM